MCGAFGLNVFGASMFAGLGILNRQDLQYRRNCVPMKVPLTWTPKVCRIIAFYRFWAIILLTFEGLGNA